MKLESMNHLRGKKRASESGVSSTQKKMGAESNAVSMNKLTEGLQRLW
jgi:hypothetical protein